MKATLQNFKKGIWITHRLTGHHFFYQNGGYISKDGEKAVLCHFITELGFEHEKTTYLFDDCLVSTASSTADPQENQVKRTRLQCTRSQQAQLFALAQRVMCGLHFNELEGHYELPGDYLVIMDKRHFQELAALFDMEIPHFNQSKKP